VVAFAYVQPIAPGVAGGIFYLLFSAGYLDSNNSGTHIASYLVSGSPRLFFSYQ